MNYITEIRQALKDCVDEKTLKSSNRYFKEGEEALVYINDQMVEIPGGKIELRDDRTKQKWTVHIEPFLLAKFPVTQDFYFEITKETPSVFKGDRRPVETVTWKDTVTFCNTLSAKSGLKSCYFLSEDKFPKC